MKIKLKRNIAKEQAQAIINAGGGETGYIEVIDELIKLAPDDTIFERDDFEDKKIQSLSLHQLKRLRDGGFDPR